MTEKEKSMIELLDEHFKDYDAIVVEGYDGVGKGRILNLLSKHYNVKPYRPDYSFWIRHDHRYADRWKVSGFFWDVYSHFNRHSDKDKVPMLFDRGVISGAVYAHDTSIAKDYKTLLRDMKVLHILVCCTKEDFMKFQDIRGLQLDKLEKERLWRECEEFTLEFLNCLDIAGVRKLIYYNRFDESEAERLSNTCEGCGHYSYGSCTNPIVIKTSVNSDSVRCEHYSDKEVQDINAEEMHSM